jgi:hypothetical protein
MICTYECTFCRKCVEAVLSNVCPNCGGGFCERPIRPSQAWVGEVSLQYQPASVTAVHKPVNLLLQRALVERQHDRSPELR